MKVKGSDVPLRLYTIDLNVQNVNKVRTQNTNFFFRLNSLKSSLVSALREGFKKFSKNNQSEEYTLLNVMDGLEEDNEDLPTIEVLNQLSFKEILFREDIEGYIRFRRSFGQGLQLYLGNFRDLSLLYCLLMHKLLSLPIIYLFINLLGRE